MLPVGDYPNPPRAQWMTRILVGINVAVHLFFTMPLEQAPLTAEDVRDNAELIRSMHEWQNEAYPGQVPPFRDWIRSVSRYDLFLYKTGGYLPGAPSILALLFCMFLHGGFGHLFGNMLFLWIYGDNVEYRLGKIPFLLWYLGTGVVATLSFAFMAGKSMTPLVGASGAISGVLGFYLVWFPHNYVKVFLFFPFFGIWPIRAVWVLGMYLVLDNLLPLYAGSGGNVAHGAHIGGFVAGAVIALLYNTIKGGPPPPRPDVADRPYRPGRGPVEPRWREVAPAPADHAGEFARAIREGRMEAAAHAFARLQREGGVRPDPHSVFRLARWLYDEDFSPDAAAVFRYYLTNFPRGEDTDRVHLGLGILLGRRLDQPTAAREHLLSAIDVTDSASIRDTARAELNRLGG